MTASRAFSTDFNDHVNLVHTFARKGWGRMIAAQVNVEYEDVFQEMSVTYTKAARSYDPSKGFSFTSYVGRAIWNEFNRYAEKYIGEQTELGLISAQDVNDEHSFEDYYESIDSGVATPEEQLIRKQEMLNNLRGLSPTAKFLAAQLMTPAPELQEAFEEHRAALIEKNGRAAREMGLRFIGNHFGIKDGRLNDAINELKSVYGV